MNKLKHITSALAIAWFASGSAQAASLVAGWDFSQYWAPFLTADGNNLSDTLAANYSQLDPTGGAGLEAGNYGTMLLPFSAVGDGSEPFLPLNLSLASNLTAPVVGGGLNPFDTFSVTGAELMSAANQAVRMAAFGPVSIVFAADLTSVPQMGDTWTLSFGAQTLAGLGSPTSDITVEFSTDGTTWVGLTSVVATAVDTAFSVALATAQSDRMFVRLGFQTGATIDNVAIMANLVPEPSVAMMLGAGLLGLLRFGRRRA